MDENDSGQAGSNEGHGPTVQDYYHVLIRIWEIQGNWFWQLWHYFLVANSILFVAFAALFEGTCAEGRLICGIVSLAGILLCVSWHIVATSHHVFQRMRIGQVREIEEEHGSDVAGPFTSGGNARATARRIGHYRFPFERDGRSVSRLLVSWPRWWRCLGLHRSQSSSFTTTRVPLGMVVLWFGLFLVALVGNPNWSCAFRVVVAVVLGLALGAGTVWFVSRLRECRDED